MKSAYELLNRIYSSEELCDVERDVSECFEFPSDKEFRKIASDENGFHGGHFKVSVTYFPGGEDSLKE